MEHLPEMRQEKNKSIKSKHGLKNQSTVPRKEAKVDEIQAVIILFIHFFIDFLTSGKWIVFVKKICHKKDIYCTFVTTTEHLRNF